MKLLIDGADIERIKKLWDTYPIDGVTTNPSILKKAGMPPFDVLLKIRRIIGDEAELHVQVISDTAEGMIAEAYKIIGVLGQSAYIKIPSVPEGYRAMKALSKEGVRLTATAIYTPMQAYLAAKSGADYAAPYVNRISDLGTDGIETAKTVQDIFKSNAFKTEVLAASFKNVNQVQSLCAYGIGAATLPFDIFEKLADNASVNSAVLDFKRDFEALCGKDATMLDQVF